MEGRRRYGRDRSHASGIASEGTKLDSMALNTQKILNILNGDCAVPSFTKAALPGEILVWREVYTEGPLDFSCDAPRFRIERAKFLSSITEYSLEKMLNWTEKLDRSILELHREDILRLWFDACMFDQSILARILFLVAQIPENCRPCVELACENVIFSEAKIFTNLNKIRQTLSNDDITNGASCWESFIYYHVPENIFHVFRFMQEALKRRKSEAPDQNGLGETQRRILHLISANSKQGIALQDLFQSLYVQEKYPWFGIETIQRFAAILAEKKLLQMKDKRYFPINPTSTVNSTH